MIHYFCVSPNENTCDKFASAWAPSLAERLVVMSYDEAARLDELPRGTFVFADIELLEGHWKVIALALYRKAMSSVGPGRIFNHPTKALGRYELMHRLHRLGLNRHRAFRLSDSWQRMSFPVFLRTDNEHLRPLTGLIHTKPELERAISFAILTGREAGRLLVVEFCDVSDATGRFRKYAAFRVGTRIIPRHLLVGCDWMQKANCGAAADEQTVAEEMEYLRANPHAAELMAIFEAAHIDYGRIDYGLKDGRINVWEINTNPTVIAMTTPYHPLRDEANRYFSERITPAFHAIDSDPPGKRIDLRDGRRRFEVEARRRMRRWRRALRDFGFRPDLAHPRVWRPLLSGLLS